VVLITYILLLEWPGLGNYDGSFMSGLFINIMADNASSFITRDVAYHQSNFIEFVVIRTSDHIILHSVFCFYRLKPSKFGMKFYIFMLLLNI
jgi:hypothetical protein